MDKPALPTRDDVLRFVAENGGKVGKREIARAFDVRGPDRVELKAMLAELTDEGLIAKSGKRLKRPGELPRVALLRVTGRDDDGDLVAEPARWEEDGRPPRVALMGRDAAAGVGDRLLARISRDDDGRALGKIIKVIERRPASVLAVVERAGAARTLTPVSRKERGPLLFDPRLLKDIEDGTLVRVSAERGRVREIDEAVGQLGSEAAVSQLAIVNQGIPDRFPPDVLAEAERLAENPVSLEGREDWRSVPVVTIDPADAKDHDDAVFAERDADVPGGVIVSVAIADVAHYVRAGSLLDREARKRGNSTYFPDRVVPMLPEAISNDACSLRENEVRPALVAKMRFDADGRQRGHTFHRVLMRSAHRLSYPEAQAIADGEPREAAPLIEALYAAYAVLKRGREARAPMELDLPERKIILSANGMVERVVVPERLDAHRLIEEFMIQANVAAATLCEEKRVPLLYRVHDAPSPEKLDALREFLATLDIRLAKGVRLMPRHFNTILAKVRGTPHEELVNEVVLRSQAQAEYAPDNLGHFGLHLRRYAHFTSPIRRYADLVVHRAIVRALGLGADGLTDGEIAELPAIGEAISATERRSMAAERETVDRLIAAWLADRVGETFPGRIGGVTKAGLFVRLDGSGGDGFVPISTIADEYLVHDSDAHALIGEASGTTYRLGDRVSVRLLEAVPVSGGLRFELVDHEPSASLRLARRPKERRSAARRAPNRARRSRR